jgi:hypothetical protein
MSSSGTTSSTSQADEDGSKKIDQVKPPSTKDGLSIEDKDRSKKIDPVESPKQSKHQRRSRRGSGRRTKSLGQANRSMKDQILAKEEEESRRLTKRSKRRSEGQDTHTNPAVYRTMHKPKQHKTSKHKNPPKKADTREELKGFPKGVF